MVTENELIIQMEKFLEELLGSIGSGEGLNQSIADNLLDTIAHLGILWKNESRIPKRAALFLIDLPGSLISWADQYHGNQRTQLITLSAKISTCINDALTD